VSNAARKLLIVVNDAAFFLSHRLQLARAAARVGYQVTVIVGAGAGGAAPNASCAAALDAAGIAWQAVPLSRSGANPLHEWRSYRALLRLYRTQRPDIVHHVTIKPVIYGSLAARAAGVPAVVNALAGLGFLFTQRGGGTPLARRLVGLLYRYAVRHRNMRYIFQNRDDLDEFVALTALPAACARLIPGAGVDLAAFPATPEPPLPPAFLLVARMLGDKGVREFVAAAQQLRPLHPDWRFCLVGDVDGGNPTSLTRAELEDWQAHGWVEWLGRRDDVAALLRAAHVVCLPSYREGLPKALLEASATGRSMIATDVPGCRDVVRDGVTGLLVPVRDSTALAAAMQRLGEDAAMRARMGRAARQQAEALYSVDDVLSATLRVYAELLL
jgi:glycosyltransferase involved in cell wall biosynthesis